MIHRLMTALCIMSILVACSSQNNLVTNTLPPKATLVSTRTVPHTLSPATQNATAQSWSETKLPAGCRFSSISPDLVWIIYLCKDELWLIKAVEPTNATLIVRDDYILATSWSLDGTEFAVGTGHLDRQNKYIAELWAATSQDPSDRRLLHRGDFYCDLQLWSPTGKWVLVAGGGGKDSPADLVRTDGMGLEEVTTPIRLMLWPYAASWSPDGTRLAYTSYELETNLSEIRILDIGNGMTTSVYTRTESFLTPAWSPDGKTVAVLVQSQPREIVFLDPAVKGALANPALPANWEGGLEIFWSPNSDRILIPFDLLRHKIGFVSLSSGDHSELSIGKYSQVLGWTKDGKSVIILGDEDDQEVIWIMPVE